MRKSKLFAAITAATMAMTMAVPSVMPQDVTMVTVKAAETVKTAETVVEGRCGDSANYSYDTAKKTLTISGTGDMWDDTGFAKTMRNAKTIIIQKGITSIGNSSFHDIDNAEKVEIADTVKTIKSEAFGCIDGTLTIPASVTKVETNAVESAKKIIVKGNMDNYQYAAFGRGADEIEICGTADKLGYALAGVYAYYNFSVTISKNNAECKVSNGCLMSADGKKVYYYVSDKTKVVIPDSVQTIKPAAFFNKFVKEVSLGKNVKTIGEYAFNNSELKKVTTNANLKTVGRCAFKGTNLKDITFKSNVTVYPEAFNNTVKIYNTKSFKYHRTVVRSATFTKKKISVKFCGIAGVKGYQVQIKKGNKTYKYFTSKNSITIKTPKTLKNTYNVELDYDIDEYTTKLEGKPAYVTVRPYKLLKNKKKTYGKWSSKYILSK